jgi:phosphoribosylamine-glycine ligase
VKTPLDCDLWWNEVDIENESLCMASHQNLDMGHRVCDVNAFSENLTDAIKKVYQNIEKIRCLGSYYRLDLGQSLWPPGRGF